MSKRTDEGRGSAPFLSIEASARARKLSVHEAANTKVRFTGRGKVVTRRENLPPSGAESGEVYHHAAVTTRIHALSPDVEVADAARAEIDFSDLESPDREGSGVKPRARSARGEHARRRLRAQGKPGTGGR